MKKFNKKELAKILVTIIKEYDNNKSKIAGTWVAQNQNVSTFFHTPLKYTFNNDGTGYIGDKTFNYTENTILQDNYITFYNLTGTNTMAVYVLGNNSNFCFYKIYVREQ